MIDITNLDINDVANAGVDESYKLRERIKELETEKVGAIKRIVELEECLDEIRLWTDDECTKEAIDEVMGDE